MRDPASVFCAAFFFGAGIGALIVLVFAAVKAML